MRPASRRSIGLKQGLVFRLLAGRFASPAGWLFGHETVVRYLSDRRSSSTSRIVGSRTLRLCRSTGNNGVAARWNRAQRAASAAIRAPWSGTSWRGTTRPWRLEISSYHTPSRRARSMRIERRPHAMCRQGTGGRQRDCVPTRVPFVLNRKPSRLIVRHSVGRLAGVRRASWNSASVRSGRSRIRAASSVSWAWRIRWRQRVCLRGATSPVSRRRCFSRSTHARLTEYFSASSSDGNPASASRSTRSRERPAAGAPARP